MSPTRTPRTALVTGGAKRVGRAVALRLAEIGMDVAITYRENRQAANDLADQIRQMGRRAVAIGVDLADPDADCQVHDQFIKSFGSLYALVNNASSFDTSEFGRITLEDFDYNMAVNARAPFMLTQRFAPMLAAHDTPGRVVNFIDIHVIGEPMKNYAPYNISKGALHEVTMSCAIELAPKVTVNAIAPGAVAWADSYSQATRDAYLSRIPLARCGTPEDAATAVKFLVCDADYCTGQIIRVDGGRALT